jgi:hypothetical protein
MLDHCDIVFCGLLLLLLNSSRQSDLNCDILTWANSISHTNLGGKEVSWLDFRRERQKGGGHRSTTHGYGFRLTFDREIQGPIILGYGAHFGLGIFNSV